ncbi:hypothetical protein DN068_05210 [Taibaiella soli]|uniref:Secretion system C-terminal sorting domain-containing protein n=2 Tax=Taibaiella soli TaxID=1649169 RepID=A0A2W2ANZ7_9BACT|nr:hypothetical protein DN068_05210 [Taibaiella soli]
MQVATGASYSPSLQITTKFWVACKSSAGCYSASVPVIGTISKLPANPTAPPVMRCDTGVVNLTANSSDTSCKTLIWYQDSLRTMQVATGSSYSPHLQSTTTFWVACKSSAGCFSASVPVVATINPRPAAPGVTPAAHCGPGSPTMVATGGVNCDSLLWYSNSSLTTRVFFGSNYSPNLNATASYWVICKSINGCSSLPTMVTDTTYPVPTLTLTNQEVCRGAIITLTATPSGGTWTSPQLGTLLGGKFNTNLVPPGMYKVAYSVTNSNGCTKTDSVKILVNNCGPIGCTVTQGYYGGNGKACDGDTLYSSPTALINKLLATNMIIGIGPKSILIPMGSGATVNAVMPGGSTPIGLTYTGQCTISTTNGSCFATNYLKNGRINNVLLSQTITLALNGRMKNGILLTIPIQQGYMVTQSTTGCGSSATTVPCSSSSGAMSQHQMTPSVANYLTNNGTTNATIADLLTLANQVLGGALIPGQLGPNNITVPSYSNVNDAVTLINETFDGCDQFIGYNIPLCGQMKPAVTTPTSVISPITAGQFTVYPNPTHGTFTVESPENMTNTVITVLDLNGRVIARQNISVSGHTVFNLENVTSGVYVIYISDGKDAFHVKIMVL